MSLDLPLDQSALIASKERLQAFLAENEAKVAQAREQLHHIEALLNFSSGFAPPPSTPRKVRAAKTSQVPPATEQPAKSPRKRRDTSLKFLPQYQNQTLTDAVLSIFRENRGKCLDADTIAKILYGDLPSDRMALAKERITKNLSKGKIDGLWQRVPGHIGYYTLSLEDIKEDIASLNLPKKTRGGRTKTATAPVVSRRKTKPVKEAKTEAPKRQRNSLRGLKMRSPYQGSTMMNAISKVLKEREGEFVNADLVVKALYGELPHDTFRLVKDRVTKSLSKGKIDGLWERVPEQTGYYTLSMSAVRA
jgi:hypothetical protein